jgi:hypothetical protein
MEPPHDGRADEAGGTGDQDGGHARKITGTEPPGAASRQEAFSPES